MKSTKLITGMAVIGGVLGVIALLLVAGTALGFVRVAFLQPTDSLQSRAVVCGEGLIKSYNRLVTTFPSSDKEASDKTSQTQDLSGRIQKLAGFEKDPTCAFMVFRIAIANKDVEVARTQLTNVEALAKQNTFPSNQILDLVSIDSMKGLLTSLTVKPGTEQQGSG